MFKYIKTGLLLAVLAYQANAASWQSEKYFDNSGGLSAHVNPFLIQGGQCSDIDNFSLDDKGQINLRAGYDIISSTGALGHSTHTVNAGGYHSADTGTNFFAVIVGTNAFRTSWSLGGTFDVVTGTVSLTATSTNLGQTTSLNDSLIFCNESDKPFKLKATGNAFALTETVFTQAKTCSTYGSYLVVANTVESSVNYPYRVRWSDINDPDSFPANNYWDVEPGDGDSITSVVQFEDSIYVFKKHSIHRMLITGLDGAGAFLIRPVARNVGAWAKNSVKAVPDVGIAFLSQNTLYILSDSGLDPIGHDIQHTLDSVSRSKWADAVSEVYPKSFEYWLAISIDGVANSKVIVYNFVHKSFTVYTGMTVNMLAQAETQSGQNALLFGDNSAHVYRYDTGTLDNPANIDTSIAASYTTADMHMGVPELTKNFKYLYLYTNVDVPASLTIEAAYDFTTVFESSTTLNLGQAGAVYDTAVYDTDLYPIGQYKVTRIELNRSSRAVKLKFSTTSDSSIVDILGWAVVYQTEDLKQ